MFPNKRAVTFAFSLAVCLLHGCGESGPTNGGAIDGDGGAIDGDGGAIDGDAGPKDPIDLGPCKGGEPYIKPMDPLSGPRPVCMPAPFQLTDGWTTASYDRPKASAAGIVHPAAPDVLFAFDQTLWASYDGGESWCRRDVAGFRPDSAGLVMMFAPSDPRIIYAQAGAIFRSKDLGATWEVRSEPVVNGVNGRLIGVDAINPNAIYAHHFFNVSLSCDGGRTWEMPPPLIDGRFFTRGIVSRERSGRVYVSFDSDASTGSCPIGVSDDAGRTWTRRALPVAFGTQCFEVMLYPGHEAVYHSTRAGAFGRSIDGGEHWSQTLAPGDAFAVVPGPPADIIYASKGGRLEVSLDHGTSWQATPAVPDSPISAMSGASTAGHIYVMTASGPARSRDGGRTWQTSARPLDPRQEGSEWISTDVVVSPLDGSAYSALDRGLVWTRDAGQTWTRASVGDATSSPAWIGPDPIDASTVFAGVLETPGAPAGRTPRAGRVRRSLDGGRTWAPWPVGDGSTADIEVFDIARCSNVPSTFYAAAASGIVHTADGGGTWATVLGTSATMPGRPNRVFVAPSDPAVAYALVPRTTGPFPGGSFVVVRTMDGGQTWSPTQIIVGGPPDGTLPGGLTTLAVHPTRPEVLLVDNGGMELFRSTNGGQSIEHVLKSASTLRRFSYNSLAFDMTNPDVAFHAANSGIWRSDDAGTSWNRIATVPDRGQGRLSTARSLPGMLLYTESGIIYQRRAN